MGHGTPPSLSVDVEANQPSDMFIQMHACFALQRVFINQQNLFPSVPPAG